MVLVINPYKAIISQWNLKVNGSKVKIATAESFKTLEFDDFVFQALLHWLEIIEDWISVGKDVYFVFYENIAEDPIAESRKLLAYLGLPVDEERLACLSKDITGAFLRTSHHTSVPFTREHHAMVRMVIDRADHVIREMNGRGLPRIKYEEYNIEIEQFHLKEIPAPQARYLILFQIGVELICHCKLTSELLYEN